jgi:lysophospholipase
MVDIKTAPYPRRVAEALATMMVRTGQSQKYIFGEGNFDPEKIDFKDNPYTSDLERLKVRIERSSNYKEHLLKGYTFGWLDATFQSIRILQDKTFGKNIKMPVLVLSPGDDQVVETSQYKKLAEKLKASHITIYPHARHIIMDEKQEIREKLWVDIDDFLKVNS